MHAHELRARALLLLALAAAPAAAGQEAAAEPSVSPLAAASDAARERPASRTTLHRAMIAGEDVTYAATAGTITLESEDGEERAHLFHIAYVRTEVPDPARRPVTFAFNGGPGSSSVWLHLGLLGPRRVELDEQGFPLPPPYRLVDNPYSLLHASDLVLIDPVSTGYSRAADEDDAGDFHGVEGDVESVAELIRLWTTRNARWASPKYLCGESYGTTRAAALAGRLQEHHGMYLDGIVLVSSVLDFGTLRFDAGNDLPYVLYLPSYAATAWYHGRLAPEHSDLGALLGEVERFAAEEYSVALLAGSRLDAEAQASLAARLAGYTGLSRDYWLRAGLRVDVPRFTKELLRDAGRTAGRLDSRFTGFDRDRAGERYEFDPSYAAIQGPYTAALNHYLRTELRYESDLEYEILTGRVQPWDYGRARNRYLNVADTLRQEMARNPDLAVFVANGYYDLATPYFATEHSFAHLSMDGDLAERVTMAYYEAGHMMYVHVPSLARMQKDLVAFYEATR